MPNCVPALLGACAIIATGGAAVADVAFTDFNLVVLGNLDSTSEVEGRTAVRGNLSGPSSTYATKLTPPAAYIGVDTLVVGGNLQATTINLNAGNLRLGGSQGSTIVNYNGGGLRITDAGAAGMVDSLGAQMFSARATLASYAATAAVTLPGSQPAGVVFNAVPGPGGVAVFTVDGNALFNNDKVQQMDLHLNGASSVIINVAGPTVSWNFGNMVGGFTTADARSKVIWNFYEATAIDLTSKALNGSLLAPAAQVSFQGVIEGSAFVGSMTQRGEVHLPLYTGVVPGPGAGSLAAAGALVALRRRR